MGHNWSPFTDAQCMVDARCLVTRILFYMNTVNGLTASTLDHMRMVRQRSWGRIYKAIATHTDTLTLTLYHKVVFTVYSFIKCPPACHLVVQDVGLPM